jgi:hypothetical protein
VLPGISEVVAGSAGSFFFGPLAFGVGLDRQRMDSTSFDVLVKNRVNHFVALDCGQSIEFVTDDMRFEFAAIASNVSARVRDGLFDFVAVKIHSHDEYLVESNLLYRVTGDQHAKIHGVLLHKVDRSAA